MTDHPSPSLADPHPTLVKFGYPESCIHVGQHWAVLVRPAQPTLGSLVLCALSDIRAYGDLPAAAFAEQGELVRQIERTLSSFCAFRKLNYLMLMMVDPQVHFHVIPRYDGPRSYEGEDYLDSGWPGLPDLARAKPAPATLVTELKKVWNENG